MTHALVVGAGIAGPVTAMALQKAGISSTVYEAYPHGGDDIGAWLFVMHNGMDALRAIDAVGPVVDAGFRTTDVEYIGADDSVYASGMMGANHPDPDGPRALKRANLYRALADELLRRGGRIQHGKRLVDARTTPSGSVTAVFADGTEATADLLVGADGTWSAVRSLIAPDAAPTYSGANLVYGYTREDVPTRPNTFRMINGSQAGLAYTTSPSGETYWAAGLPGDPLTRIESQHIKPQQWLDMLLERYAADPGEIPSQVIGVPQEQVLVYSTHRMTTALSKWHSGPMVLVGDAAHTTGPAAGQGASVALEDGVILAKCLRDIPDRTLAFDTYQRLRVDRIQRLLDLSGRQVRTLAEAKANADPSVRAFLYSHEIHWDDPIKA